MNRPIPPRDATGAAAWLLAAVVVWPAIVPALAPWWYGEAFFSTYDAPKGPLLVGGALVVALTAWRRGAARVALDARLVLPSVLALTALAAAWSAGIAGSLTGPAIAVAALLAAWAVSTTSDAAQGVRRVARSASWVTALAGIYGLVQVAGWDVSELGGRRFAASFFGNPSFAAAFLAAALPLAAFTAAGPGATRNDRVVGWAAVVLGIAHLIVARSRIDYLAFAAAAGVAGVLLLHGTGRRRAAAWFGGAGCAAAVALGAAFVLAAGGADVPVVGRGDTLAVRAHIWDATGRMIAAHPLRVTGLSFEDLYPAWRQAEEFVLSKGRDAGTPHQDLLAVGARLGVAGILAALALVVSVARAVVRGPRESLPARAALAASLTATLVSGLASSPLSHPPTALLAALCLGHLAALANQEPRRTVAFPVVVAVLGVAALSVLPATWADARCDAFLATAQRRLATDGRSAIPLLRSAVAADSRSYAARYELGTLLGDSGAGEEGIAMLREAALRSPGSLSWRVNLASGLRRAGRGEEAAQVVDEGLGICPWHPLLLAARAALAMDGGDPARALEDLDRAVERMPAEPRLAVRRAEVLLVTGPPDTAHPQAVAALDGLLRHRDLSDLARAVPAYVGRDPSFLATLVAFAKRIVGERPQDARALILAAQDAGSGDVGFLYDAAQVLGEAKDGPGARWMNGHAWAVRAREAHADGRDEEAIRYANKAADRAPTTAHFLLLARIRAALGERSTAVEAVGQALALGNFDPQTLRDDPHIGALLPDPELEELLRRAAERLR